MPKKSDRIEQLEADFAVYGMRLRTDTPNDSPNAIWYVTRHYLQTDGDEMVSGTLEHLEAVRDEMHDAAVAVFMAHAKAEYADQLNEYDPDADPESRHDGD